MSSQSAPFTSDSIPAGSLNGKVALVTGGNTGIGLVNVTYLAKAGAKVFMASRNKSKALKAIEEIQDEPARARVEFVQLDLAKLASAKEAAETVVSRTDRLDIVITNAGVAGLPYSLSEDGIESLIQANHLGHFVLIHHLLPVLLKTAETTKDVRVVTVSSVMHFAVAAPASLLQFRSIADLNSTLGPDSLAIGPTRRYAYSKFENILFARELERRYGKLGLHGIPTHPGVVRSSIWDNISAANPYIWKYIMSPFLNYIFTDTHQGGSAALFGATKPDVIDLDLKHRYIGPGGRVTRTWGAASDERLQRELWDLSEAVMREKLG